MQVNMHEAKTHFSRLVDRALAGESIIIARNGKAVLRLTPLEAVVGIRVPGLSAGKGKVAEDFDEPLDEKVLKGFE